MQLHVAASNLPYVAQSPSKRSSKSSGSSPGICKLRSLIPRRTFTEVLGWKCTSKRCANSRRETLNWPEHNIKYTNNGRRKKWKSGKSQRPVLQHIPLYSTLQKIATGKVCKNESRKRLLAALCCWPLPATGCWLVINLNATHTTYKFSTHHLSKACVLSKPTNLMHLSPHPDQPGSCTSSCPFQTSFGCKVATSITGLPRRRAARVAGPGTWVAGWSVTPQKKNTTRSIRRLAKASLCLNYILFALSSKGFWKWSIA